MEYNRKKGAFSTINITSRIIFMERNEIMKKLFFLLILSSFSLGLMPQNSSFDTLDGGKITYNEILGNKGKHIVMFWASSCPVCVKAIKNINNIIDKNEDIKFFLVNLGESKNYLERLCTANIIKKEVRPYVILDPKALFAYDYRISVIPTYIFFENGEPIYRGHWLSNALINEVYQKK